MDTSYSWVISVLLIIALGILIILRVSLSRRRTFSFSGKHAFVTGGSKGIGKELAIALLRRGCKVTIASRNVELLKSACSELSKLSEKLENGSDVNFVSVDFMSHFEKIRFAVETAKLKFGPIRLLINNVGGCKQNAFEKLDVDDFENQLKLNYLSAVYTCRAVVEDMKLSSSSHIAFVCSLAAQFPVFGYTAYSPSKCALKGFAEALTMELSPYNISISIIYPPNTNTEGFEEELRTMPNEISYITKSAGLYEPKDVAERILDDIASGNFSTCFGISGLLLNVGTSGSSPENNFLHAIQQILLAGTARFTTLIYMAVFNRYIEKSKRVVSKHSKD